MATVRFSQDLKAAIIKNARAMFDGQIRTAKANVPSHWADKIYENFFSAEDVAKFNALPAWAMKTMSSIQFGGFYNAPSDVYQTAHHRTDAYRGEDVQLEFSSSRPWPNEFKWEVTGFKIDWRTGTADYGDERWAWLVPEYKEYKRKIFEAEAKQHSFVDGVQKVIDAYVTLAPALKAWPPLWELLPEETKERHKKIVDRPTRETTEIGADLGTMTAAVTFAKLTR